MVRTVKTSIRKILGRSLVTEEELRTVLCQVEAVINARPLCYVSEDDLQEPLTPNHLMFGNNILNSSSQYISSLPKSHIELSRRVNYIRSLLEKFRKRFYSSYLNELRQKQLYRKTKSCQPSLSINDVVLVKDDKPLPRNEWRIGRIIGLVHGKDGFLRGAKLRMIGEKGSQTTAHRPIQKIIPFEISTEHIDSEPIETEPKIEKLVDIPHDNRHNNNKRPHRKTAVEGQYMRRLREKLY